MRALTYHAMCALVLVFGLFACALADKVHSQNKRANKLYEQQEYEKALELYNEALLEAPNERALQANRGSALHRLERFDDAKEAYEAALESDDKDLVADVHYNLGNTLFREGERLMSSGDQKAMEAFKAAKQEYVQTLKHRPSDDDAKWNLQLAHNRIKMLEQQQKQQNKQQDKEDKQNKDQKQQDGQNEQDKQKKQDEKKSSEDEEQKQGDSQDDGDQQKDEQKGKDQDEQGQPPKPQPGARQQEKEKLKKEEAARMLRQFADDDEDLNKPEKVKRAIGVTRPEKDW
jgi:Ca-activated chloride channel homolog